MPSYDVIYNELFPQTPRTMTVDIINVANTEQNTRRQVGDVIENTRRQVGERDGWPWACYLAIAREDPYTPLTWRRTTMSWTLIQEWALAQDHTMVLLFHKHSQMITPPVHTSTVMGAAIIINF